MARPRLDAYDQRTTPQGGDQPMLRAPDSGQGIGAALSRAGSAVEELAQAGIANEEADFHIQEDDARVYASRALAEARAKGQELRHTTFENAPDGWRGATQTVSTEFGKYRDEVLKGAPTPLAERFLSQAFDAYQPDLLADTAEQEYQARDKYQADTTQAAINTAGSVIEADPSQYEKVRAEQLGVLATISNPNLRRDATANAEENFAVSAVQGIVDRDPHTALTQLRDPNAEGPYSRLSGPQRAALTNQAQAEINRREAEARAARSQMVASLRDNLSAQNELLAEGIMPQNLIDPQAVETYLGPDVAQAYIGHIARVTASQGMVHTSLAQIARDASAPLPEGSDLSRLVAQRQREAALQVSQQRGDDPGGYAVRNRLFRHGDDLVPTLGNALQSGDWRGADRAFRDRGADALEARASGILATVAPLSKEEASALGTFLHQQSATDRTQILSHLAATMNSEAFTAMMGQVAPQAPAMAHAAMVGAQFGRTVNTRAGPLQARDAGALIMLGDSLLHPRAEQEGQAAPRPLSIPGNDRMERQFNEFAGDAYLDQPTTRAQHLNAFSAAYAALASRKPPANSNVVDYDTAQDAFAIATGGVTRWRVNRGNSQNVILPWGMDNAQFQDSIEHSWANYLRANPLLGDRDIHDYRLTPNPSGGYDLTNPNGQPVRNNGRPITLSVVN